MNNVCVDEVSSGLPMRQQGDRKFEQGRSTSTLSWGIQISDQVLEVLRRLAPNTGTQMIEPRPNRQVGLGLAA